MTSEPAYETPVAVSATATLVLAANPGIMTLTGTNTWLLAAPGSDEVVVVDPGPLLASHLDAVGEALGGRRVAAVLLTHGHPDHAEGAELFARTHATTVHTTFGSDAAGIAISTLTTPGHTSDSVSYLVAAEAGAAGQVLTGDTVLGTGTTVVAHPDGVLADYLASLEKLEALGDVTVLPGHGPVLPNAGDAARRYLAHRQARLEQVRAALAAGAETTQDVVQAVYADVDPVLWPAASLSVEAQLLYLRQLEDRGGS